MKKLLSPFPELFLHPFALESSHFVAASARGLSLAWFFFVFITVGGEKKKRSKGKRKKDRF